MEKFENLKALLKQLPGIGDKTSERLLFFMISKGKEYSKSLSEGITAMSDSIKICSICGGVGEIDPCEICKDDRRENGILMVVEKPKDLFIFERMKRFTGKYHVLGGLISPLDGITPEKLTIDNLLKRIKSENVREVILALSPTTEGETTAIYLSRLLMPLTDNVSTIARGVPFGTDFEYIDEYTLQKSIDKRQKYSE